LRRNAFRFTLRRWGRAACGGGRAIFFLFANLLNYAGVFDVYRAPQQKTAPPQGSGAQESVDS
jgi:hypothetical protein